MKMHEFRAMNTSVVLALDRQGSSDEGLRETQAFIEDCEQRFSRFLPDSELSRLNAQAGQWAEISQDLFNLLALSKAYHQETGGLFDPAVLPDLKRVGYDASLDVVRQRGDLGEVVSAEAPKRTFASIEFDAEKNRVRLPVGMQIDLGGIAKGWIVQEAATRLRAHGTAAAVSAGGDMYFAGWPADGTKWQVEIEDPRDAGRTAARLAVGQGAVVTSSVSKRTWRRGGEIRHHIIDPRTREPARAEWLSVTVIASDADLAEAYAKAFLIGGRQQSTRLMLQRPHLAVMCIGADGQIFASPNSREYLNDRNQFLQ
jgi:thiamine biosynthesis lipoprotein